MMTTRAELGIDDFDFAASATAFPAITPSISLIHDLVLRTGHLYPTPKKGRYELTTTHSPRHFATRSMPSSISSVGIVADSKFKRRFMYHR
jgi:hypothetical protein